jgi:hypothetical protein
MAMVSDRIGSLLVVAPHQFTDPFDGQSREVGDLLRRFAQRDLPQDLSVRARASVRFVLIPICQLFNGQMIGHLYAFPHTWIIFHYFISCP